MLRKIINIIVLVVIIGAISIIFINLYNESKTETNNFKSTKEQSNTATKDTKNKKDTKDKSQTSTKEDKKTNTNEKDNNDNKTNDTNNPNEENPNTTSTITGNEIAVASTSSFKNTSLTVIGSLIILIGAYKITVKLKKQITN